jgi:hypothetical protein
MFTAAISKARLSANIAILLIAEGKDNWITRAGLL